MTRRRGLLYVTGAIALAAPPALWLLGTLTTRPGDTPPLRPPVKVVLAASINARPVAGQAAVAARDPLALITQGRAWYREHVQSYSCTFVKQELVEGGLTPVQDIEVRYRNEPRTVYMLWRSNPNGARRALFSETPDYFDSKGRALARVEPSGAVARLFVKDTLVRLDSSDARKVSRRSIAEFGFISTYDLLERYNATASATGTLKLWYAGEGEVDDRPTFVIKRDLPYEGPDGPYPDARMVMHIDQEWLLPVAVYSFADHDEHELLGSYVYADVEFNPAFGDDAFSF